MSKMRSLALVSLLAWSLSACDDDEDRILPSDGAIPGTGDGGVADAGGDAAPAVACPTSLVGATVVADSIATPTTWSGLVSVTKAVTIRQGGSLTILPGTTVVMAVDSDLEIGWNSGVATVKAEGTAAAPITFCGANPVPGGWKGISVERNVTSDSTFRYVNIRHTGGAMTPGLSLEGIATLDNVTVSDGSADGVHAADFGAGSTGLSVQRMGGRPVVLTAPGAFTHFPLGGILTGNANDTVPVRFDSIAVNTTIHKLPIPYVQESKVIIRDTNTVVIEAGVQYHFAADAELEVGWNSTDPTFTVAGTVAEPVVFRGVGATPGFWKGLTIERNVRTASSLSHVQIWHGGGGTGADVAALKVLAAIKLDNVTLNGNKAGVRIGQQGLAAMSTMVNVTGTQGVPATIEPEAWVTLPVDGSFTGNMIDQITVEGDSFAKVGTIKKANVPYFLAESIRFVDGSAVTIEAGSQFIAGSDVKLEFGWNSGSMTLTAMGTMAAPIIFRGAADTAGFWEGLILERNVRTDSKLDHVQVSHAGKAGGAALTIQGINAPFIPVTNSRFSKSAGFGIRKAAANTSTYLDTNTFEATAAGTVGTL